MTETLGIPDPAGHLASEHLDRNAWHDEMTVALKPSALRDLLFSPLRDCGYENPQFDDPNCTVTATRTTQIAPPLSGSRITQLTLNWEPVAGDLSQTRVRWKAVDKSPGSNSRPDRAALQQLLSVLRAAVDETISRPQPPAPPHDPIVGPNESPPDGPFSGTLRDYSGFAAKDEVTDLTSGVLPLGRWTFAPFGRKPDVGPPLFMAPDLTGPKGSAKPREFRGTLICAPQNSGKTSLIIRWAEAANGAGYSLFIIDVKGNLRTKLAGKVDGPIYYFSTDPDEKCDRMNFLSGLDPLTPKGSEMIREVATTLLPREGHVDRGSKEDFYFRNDSVWLTALIHLLKLREAYWPEYFLDDQGQPREPDLSDLYEVARDEDVLYRWIDDLRVDETLLREAGTDPPACGVDYWVKELVLLISPERMPPRHFLAESALEKTGEGALDAKVAESLKPLAGQMFGNSDIFLRAVSKLINDETLLQANLEQLLDLTALLPEGQRDKEYGYRQYTQAIVTALEPFARHGTLYPKIRSVGDGQQFALADLDRQDQKVTVLIAAREQDQEKASTVLSLSIKRLQQVLFNRMARSDKALKPVVLLLDETRRIRAFKANEYVTFAREAQTACVVVYQSIDQIGDTQAITELLENIGTQIYLGTVVGNTARSFIRVKT